MSASQQTMQAWVTSVSPFQVKVAGANTACSAELSGPYPQSVTGDANGTLSEVSTITGLSAAFMTANTIYASVASAGGWHVNFYKQASRATLIAHTANFAADGSVTVSANGSSGIGGTVTIAEFATIAATAAISVAVAHYSPVLGDRVQITVRTPQRPLITGKVT